MDSSESSTISEVEQWKSLPPEHMARSTKMPWYSQRLEHKLTPSFRRLLEEWSGIAPEVVVSHIYRNREESWKVFPWPCIGEFWFIEQGLLRHPDYARVLAQLEESDEYSPRKFLDLGTCLGQDLRTLALDGAPLSSLYGADVLPGFEAAGHALFKDEERFDSSHFITGDVFSDTDDLAKSRGSWDMIHIAMFLHVFSLERQEKACENMLHLLKNAHRSTIFGTQTGRLDAGELVLQPPMCEPGEHKTIFRHNKETLKEMWEKAASSVGRRVHVWAEYDEEDASERLKDQSQKGVEEELRERFFTGDRERRVFFHVEIIDGNYQE